MSTKNTQTKRDLSSLKAIMEAQSGSVNAWGKAHGYHSNFMWRWEVRGETPSVRRMERLAKSLFGEKASAQTVIGYFCA